MEGVMEEVIIAEAGEVSAIVLELSTPPQTTELVFWRATLSSSASSSSRRRRDAAQTGCATERSLSDTLVPGELIPLGTSRHLQCNFQVPYGWPGSSLQLGRRRARRSPQNHEWGRDVATEHATPLTVT